MARGWESKSVQAQIDAAETPRRAVTDNTPSPEQLARLRQKDNILLSRTRVVRELDSVHNPRYKALLSKALADLDAQLSTFR